jgi:ATP-binding cassette subfamily F protein uup
VAPANLLNLEKVSVDFGKGRVLDEVSLGISAGARIGIVGRNGGGKSTLMRVMAGLEEPHSGRLSVSRDADIGILSQVDAVDPQMTVRTFVVGESHDHVWASDAQIREIFTGLFGDFDDVTLDRTMGPLSGGERRRVSLAKLLIADHNVILLDEPTNHLDVEAVAWLAQHLKSRRDLALAVVTHDRWFLDEISDKTWEVIDGKVEEYEGGYSAFVLAKAERIRQSKTEEQRRNQLIRKELAWLRRGAPARTTKPKFRVDAANELISNEPPPRNNVELLSFANARLGKTVFEMHDIDVALGERKLLSRVTWNIGPGQRIGVVGLNGAGKTTLLRVLTNQLKPAAGKLVVGSTVKIAFLSQHLEELNPQWRVLEAVEQVAKRVELGKGRELSASQLCERLGFPSDAQWTPVGDLSGGERRRLQLTRLLMSEPNVLILDEPTNDFDVETLAALEDLLDSFAGTLLVVSHDRYFLERACDTFVGLLGDGNILDLPRGIDQYLELRAAFDSRQVSSSATTTETRTELSAAELRDLKKEISRIERSISRVDEKIAKIHQEMAAVSNDYQAIASLDAQLRENESEKNALEEQWLEKSAGLA